jgi:hypothetical protein
MTENEVLGVMSWLYPTWVSKMFERCLKDVRTMFKQCSNNIRTSREVVGDKQTMLATPDPLIGGNIG